MKSLDGGTFRQSGRTGVALSVLALLSGSSVTAITAQTTTDVAPVVANQVVQSPVDLYRTWLSMAGQVSRRLARANDRLPKGPVAGLTGKASFVSDHMAVLDQSVKVLEGGAKIPGARLKAHQTQVLAFLNRATEIDRLLNDLERSEAGNKSGNGATLRKNISALAGARLFGALEPSTPARLRVLRSGADLSATYWPNTINRLKIAVENTGDEAAADLAVTLSPNNSLIALVSDGQGSCTARGSNWKCRTASLGAGQQWPIAVTLRHPTPYQVGAGAPTRVGVSITTALAGKRAANTTTIFYRVANCRANFGRAITKIGAREGAALRAALKAVQSGADSLSGTWISQVNAPLSDKLGQVFSSAAGIVEARGGDPWFTTTDDGRAVARVVSRLYRYLRQTKSSAQCLSARRVIAAEREKLKPLYRRMAQVAANRASALRMATATVTELERSAGRPNSAPPAQSGDARTLLARLDGALDPGNGSLAGANAANGSAGSAGRPGLRGSAGAPFSRLEALSARLPARPGDKGKALLQKARIGLASIEASVYFELALGRYNALIQSFETIFEALLAAQNTSCSCKTGNIAVSAEKSSAPGAAQKSVSTPARRQSRVTGGSRAIINPPSPRLKPADLVPHPVQARQRINNVRAAARRAATKRRARRLGNSVIQSD